MQKYTADISRLGLIRLLAAAGHMTKLCQMAQVVHEGDAGHALLAEAGLRAGTTMWESLPNDYKATTLSLICSMAIHANFESADELVEFMKSVKPEEYEPTGDENMNALVHTVFIRAETLAPFMDKVGESMMKDSAEHTSKINESLSDEISRLLRG